jgi:UDPglucose 6-dehydrogenase
MNVAVVGAGYVGLVTAACLAELGNDVVGIENDPGRLAILLTGGIPIYEEGLAELVQRNVAAGCLIFTDNLPCAVNAAQVVFLCVGTPPGEGGQPDLSQIEAVATSIGRVIDPRYRVIVTKSTVPVGSGDWVSELIREAHRTGGDDGIWAFRRSGVQDSGEQPQAPDDLNARTLARRAPGLNAAPHFDVVSNPEFLREGSAIRDMLFPDRIVLGSSSPRALSLMRALYRPLLEQSFPWDGPRPRCGPVPLVETDLASAEMIKYAANAFLATKISFINEIANICERTGADVRAVAHGIGLDHRIGKAFLQAGIGWGGSCFPKDVAALTAMAADYGYEAPLLAAVQQVNARQRLLVVQKLQERLKVLKGKTIGLLGLAFKAGTDDLRDAPALTLAHRLHELGAKVRAYDPHAAAKASHLALPLTHAPDLEHLAQDADALVLVTDWPEFRELPFRKLAPLMRCPLIVDGRNSLDRELVTASGLEYLGIGR